MATMKAAPGSASCCPTGPERPVRIQSDRRYCFPVGPTAFWDALGDTEAWPSWWPWLRSFESAPLTAGSQLRGRVKPPLPYSVSVRLHIREAIAPRLIVADVTGGVTGEARVDVAEHDAGCEVRLRSSLGPTHPGLRAVAGVIPAVARFGHDWVLDAGARQFRSRAL